MRKFLVALLLLSASVSFADDPSRVLAPGEKSQDARLGPLRTLNDKYHPWAHSSPTFVERWEEEAERIRTQLLVSNGLWPMPPKTPLNPVIHGTVERDGYIIQRVFFESLPGHFVTGSLYRPAQLDGKAPGVLCPHGHWENARFYVAGDAEAQKLIDGQGEKFLSGARNPLQARMVHLAKMGCIVFHYDMVGYSDSKQIEHRAGFTDVQAGLWLQNAMGLQTWNSLRALDFLCSLPEVDTARIGVTGASGGGTQTFMLCALDPRPTVAFPAVMVSTAMQGGCICENADYLRLGINNVAIAALFAPKPMAMSGANDWTIDIETKGYPELQFVYSLYDAKDNVYAKCYPQFGHNYNSVSRRMMYEWFKQHLKLPESASVEETEFNPASRDELTVFDTDHMLPAHATDAEGVKKYLTEVQTAQYQALLPDNADEMSEYRRIVGAATAVFFGPRLATPPEQEPKLVSEQDLGDNIKLVKVLAIDKAKGSQIPTLILATDSTEHVVVWIDGKGKSHLFNEAGQLRPEITKLLKGGYAVISIDPFLTGELVGPESTDRVPVDKNYSGYTFGYNYTTIAQRVGDIIYAVEAVVGKKPILVGTGDAGLWSLLAAGQVKDKLELVIANLNGFEFGKLESTGDPNYLPGALRYGGVGGLTALAAPQPLIVAGVEGISDWELDPLKRVYKAADAKLDLRPKDLTREEIVELILKR